MDKNSIIGWVLIALLMIGFFGYQSRQVKKQQEWQAQLDSLAAVEAHKQDSIRAAYLAEHPEDTVVAALPVQAAVYSDSLLNAAANADAQTVTLQNEKLEVVFTTMGAQPLSVRVKDFQTYDKSDLYILKEGQLRYCRYDGGRSATSLSPGKIDGWVILASAGGAVTHTVGKDDNGNIILIPVVEE